AIPSTSISTPDVTSATSGFLCSGMPGVVCSAIASQTISTEASGIPSLPETFCAAMVFLNLQSRLSRALAAGQADVVKHPADIEQFGIALVRSTSRGERTAV